MEGSLRRSCHCEGKVSSPTSLGLGERSQVILRYPRDICRENIQAYKHHVGQGMLPNLFGGAHAETRRDRKGCHGDPTFFGVRPRGRPKTRWTDVVRKDLQSCNVSEEDTSDRAKWRRKTRKADPTIRWE
ncbi:hypothetical protein ACJJTC_005381 [Scirpophaga incertulas]